MGPTVAQLIEQLERLPPDKFVICQIVQQEKPTEGKPSAWNMCFSFEDTRSKFVQLRVEHPELTRLPEWPEKGEPT